MRDYPLVSVIIPTFNYAAYICDAIKSVLDSTFPKHSLEIIVVDDGSTDNTVDVLAPYKNQIKYIRQENSGKAWATQIAINYATGKYIFNLDADDLYLPNKIEKVVEIFEADTEIVHVAHPAIIWNTAKKEKLVERIPKSIIGHQVHGKELLLYLYRRNLLFGGGTTFAARSQVLKQLSIPREVDMFIDEYLVLHTLLFGKSFLFSEPLSVWRVHQNNYSGSDSQSLNYSLKLARSQKSKDAVLVSIQNGNFPREIKALYHLKLQVASLAIKEFRDQKNFSDILELWHNFMTHIHLFRLHSPLIFWSYTMLNRSLPSTFIKQLKWIKSKYIS